MTNATQRRLAKLEQHHRQANDDLMPDKIILCGPNGEGETVIWEKPPRA